MKKLILLFFLYFISFSSAFAGHGKYTCTKNKSILYDAKEGLKGGEIILLPSYTTMGLYNVLNDRHLSNPVTVTGYLTFPTGSRKVPVVIITHGSGGAGSLFTNSYFLLQGNNICVHVFWRDKYHFVLLQEQEILQSCNTSKKIELYPFQSF